MPVRGDAREEGELFGVEPKPSKPLPPHKRIAWNPEDGWSGFTDADMDAFAKAAPACDIDRQLSSADLWLRANPAKAHKQNFYRFFVSWIGRQQERGGDAPRQNGHAAKEPPKSFKLQEQEAREAARFGTERIVPKLL